MIRDGRSKIFTVHTARAAIQAAISNSFRVYAWSGLRYNYYPIRRFQLQHGAHALGQPTDTGALLAFLLSDDAQWITGQVLAINGGSAFRD
jgi:NAD(P)-dependent dehydrogenase (short-subunit alcohol dehydrogenase family)